MEKVSEKRKCCNYTIYTVHSFRVFNFSRVRKKRTFLERKTHHTLNYVARTVDRIPSTTHILVASSDQVNLGCQYCRWLFSFQRHQL